MTVKELIECLEKCHKDEEVLIRTYDNYYNSFTINDDGYIYAEYIDERGNRLH